MDASGISPHSDFAAGSIVFGWGRWREVGPEAARLGTRAFLVLGSRALAAGGLVAELRDVLGRHGVDAVELAAISREPLVEDVDQATNRLRSFEPRSGDMLIALGGGSAIDLAKATAAMATNFADTSVRDYLEGVGRGLKIAVPPLPLIAMPTTAGTGSEATKNAVISSYDPPFKKSLRSDLMTPRTVIVDPQLTVSVPPDFTAWTGMDAITQLIESYISRRARHIAQVLTLGGLPGALGAIVEAVEQPNSRPAREAMAYAALLSGMALADSGLGMAHGVAAALGVHARVPHGLACAVMLPVALRVNREVSRRQLGQLARAISIAPEASEDDAADAFIQRIDEICDRLRVPRRLSALGVTPAQIPDLVRDSRGNSMDSNPRSLTDHELTEIVVAQL